MADEPNLPAAPKLSWQPRQLLVMCAVCLALGFLAGYLLRGSASAPTSALPSATHATGPSSQPDGPVCGPIADDAAHAKRNAHFGRSEAHGGQEGRAAVGETEI